MIRCSQSEGKAAFNIELVWAGHYLLFTSDAAFEEAKQNLAIKYPDRLPLRDDFLDRITLFNADLYARKSL